MKEKTGSNEEVPVKKISGGGIWKEENGFIFMVADHSEGELRWPLQKKIVDKPSNGKKYLF